MGESDLGETLKWWPPIYTFVRRLRKISNMLEANMRNSYLKIVSQDLNLLPHKYGAQCYILESNFESVF
jgi:hypothetical protein